jgi:hypothetical protein
MEAGIKEFLSQIKIGAKQTHKNMTLYCLLAAHEADVNFLTLDEALDQKLLSVTELGESGSVPELKVLNRSDQKVLMLDGEELVGAKQNRVLNVTILIAPQSETIIPVSCVEQGRWSYRSREFRSARRTMSADLKRKKSQSVRENLRAAGSFASAQGMVWQEIDAKFARMAADPSPTMALSDLYERHQDVTEDFLKAFHPVDNQVGMVVFIDGEVVGIEFLGGFETFEKNHSKLVQSYVMDALETVKDKGETEVKASKAKASKILQSAAKAPVERRKSVALGNDVRVESKKVVGAGLEYGGEVLHLSIFVNDLGEEGPEKGARMARAAFRKRSLKG